jgi:hypothetical protein
MNTAAIVAAASLAVGTSVCVAQTLNANPGPANNGGSANWAIFFDLEALGSPVVVHEMTTASSAAAGVQFQIEVFVREGTALGGPASAGAGSSLAGWTSLGFATATQGAVGSGVSLPFEIPPIDVGVGQIVGVALRFSGVGPRYFGTGTPPYGVYSDGVLRLTTGDARSAPFSPTGSFFTSRELVGSLTYLAGGICYANCDGSTVEPVLNVDDFTCFINEFASAQTLPHEQQVANYANCDQSTIAPALNVDDFTCFINLFALGCP